MQPQPAGLWLGVVVLPTLALGGGGSLREYHHAKPRFELSSEDPDGDFAGFATSGFFFLGDAATGVATLLGGLGDAFGFDFDLGVGDVTVSSGTAHDLL